MNSSGLYKIEKSKSSPFFNKKLILFPINIFKAFDLNYTQKSLLGLCFLYQNSENLIDMDTIAYKWNNHGGYKIQRKLMNHLRDLEDKGYLSIIYQYNKPIRLILKPHPVFLSLHVGLQKDLVYRANFSFDENLLYLYYMSQSIKWCNHSTQIAADLGLHRTTVQKYSATLEKKGFISRVSINKNGFRGKREKYAISASDACTFITRNKFVHKAVDTRVRKPTLLKYNYIIFKDKFFFKKKEAKEAVKNKLKRAKEFRKIQNITFMQDETISLNTYLKDDSLLEKIQNRVKTDKDEIFDLNYIRSLAKKGTVPNYAEISFYEDKLYGLLMNDKYRTGAQTEGWDADYVWEKTYSRKKCS